MVDQWEMLLRNVGEWRGSFETFDRHLQLLRRQPSILKLERAASGVPINLSLRFWPDNRPAASDPFAGDPIKQVSQCFMSPDPNLGLFSTGSFNRGTSQVSSWARLYVEFSFLHADRRHRLVLLWDGADRFDQLVLIREFRAGTSALENPTLTSSQLMGAWQAQDTILHRDDSRFESAVSTCAVQLDSEHLEGLTWLPDGGAVRLPRQLDLQHPFMIEALWMPTPQCLEWMQRCYDAGGRWTSTRHRLLSR